MTEPTCPTCKKPYAEHPGVAALCRDLTAAKAGIERLKALFKQERAIHRVLNREKNAELAAAKAREEKVREDVAELRAWLELVYSTLRGIGSYTPEPQLTAANQIDYVLSKLDELETFKEGT